MIMHICFEYVSLMYLLYYELYLINITFTYYWCWLGLLLSKVTMET